MNRMSYETQNFDGYFSHFTIYHFGLNWLLAKLSTKNYHQLVQTAKTISNYHVEFEHVQTKWKLMIADDSA